MVPTVEELRRFFVEEFHLEEEKPSSRVLCSQLNHTKKFLDGSLLVNGSYKDLGS